jgi:hypothetical protein
VPVSKLPSDEYVVSKVGTVHILGQDITDPKRRKTLCHQWVREGWQLGSRIPPNCPGCLQSQRDRQLPEDEQNMPIWARCFVEGTWRTWFQAGREVEAANTAVEAAVRTLLCEGDVPAALRRRRTRALAVHEGLDAT